ncbi:MAG TPA: hypothetical protein PLP23_00265 [Panacibacter sp.]|nr:hypothetical protein [Panacibacter sp.]
MWKRITGFCEMISVDQIVLLSPCNPEQRGGAPIYLVFTVTGEDIVLHLVTPHFEEYYEETEDAKNNKVIKLYQLQDEGWWMNKVVSIV